MRRLIKCFIFLMLIIFSLLFVYSCSSEKKLITEGYRYVSVQRVPRDKMDKMVGKAYWSDTSHYINKVKADSFYLYPKFDSIRMETPAGLDRSLFRKTAIKAISWKARESYGNLMFVGNYTADHLRGMYISFYVAKDRSAILEAYYTYPGHLIDAILFHKDSVNILKKQGILVEPTN